jgi:formate dehydrogenase subunit delta
MSATGSSVVRMANQIALNFAALGRDEAVAAIAAHIGKYWDPRMKAAAAGLLAEPDSGFSALAREALRQVDAR